MDTLNIIFGAIGVISFGFSIYSHYSNKTRREIERAKALMQKERLRAASISLLSIFHTIDSIVQIPKAGSVTTEQLQHIARIARAQVYSLASEIELEVKKLESWQFGKLVKSDYAVNDVIKEDLEADDSKSEGENPQP